MKGFAKRLGICILLISLLIVSVSAASAENCPGQCTHAAAIGTIHYDTLEEAVAAATEKDTVKLLADCGVSAPLSVSETIYLDLGGKTLTGSLQLSKGGSIQNGKLLSVTDTALLVSGGSVTIEKDAVLEGSGSLPTVALTSKKDQNTKLTVQGTVSGNGPAPVIEVSSAEGSCELLVGKYAKVTALDNPAIHFDSAGKLNISGGTIQAEKDAVLVTIAEKRETELSVTGGKILSGGKAIVLTVEEKAEAPKDFITGGTYQNVPTDYIPAYCVIRDNNDTTYTVISAYTVTYANGGGKGNMDAVEIRCGDTIKLPKCKFTCKGKDFAGWEIGGKTYAPGDAITPDGDITVTALWKTHKHSGGKATCLQKAVCDVCDQSYGKLGSHNLTSAGGYAATCTEGGMDAYKACSTCGGCFVDGTEVLPDSLSTPALGHNWETVDGIPATCNQDGMKTYSKCLTCELIHVDGAPAKEEELVIPATGHTMEIVEATQATCSDAGIQAHEHCTECDGVFVKGEEVEPQTLTTALSSHVLSDWVSDETYHWKTCVDCQEIFRQKEHTDTDANASCDDCGYVMELSSENIPGESGFSPLFLIPVAAAVVIAVSLIIKKRK